MCNFLTRISVTASPSELRKVSEAVAKLKESLAFSKNFKCSKEEHIFLCASDNTLVKVVPSSKGLISPSVRESMYEVLEIVIESKNPIEIVEIDELVTKNLSEEGLRYRRIE